MKLARREMVSRNMIGNVDSEAVALEMVRKVIDAEGVEFASPRALVTEDNRGQLKTLVQGTDLVARAVALAA